MPAYILALLEASGDLPLIVAALSTGQIALILVGIFALFFVCFLMVALRSAVDDPNVSWKLDADALSNIDIPDESVLLDAEGKILCTGSRFRKRFNQGEEVEHMSALQKIVGDKEASFVSEAINTISSTEEQTVLEPSATEISAGAPSFIKSILCPSGDYVYLAFYQDGPTRVLIADDEPSYRDMVARYLRSRGYEVQEGAHGGEAVEKARDFHPDVVLMDLNMPEMDGFEASRRMRDEEEGFTPPIVAVTGLKEEDIVDRCHESGISQIVQKPMELAELDRVICEQLEAVANAA